MQIDDRTRTPRRAGADTDHSEILANPAESGLLPAQGVEAMRDRLLTKEAGR